MKPLELVRPDFSRLPDGLVGAWYFVEGGGDPFNLVSMQRAAIVGPDCKWSTSPYGRAFRFDGDGDNDRLDLGSIPSTHPLSFNGSNECTIIARVLFETPGNDFPRIIDKSSSGSGSGGWSFYIEDKATQRLVFSIAGSNSRTTSETFTSGQWYTLAASVVGSTRVRFFIDNAFRQELTPGNDFPANTVDAAIGNWNHSTDRNWKGLIECVLAFDRALTDDEVVRVGRDLHAPWPEPIARGKAPAVGGVTVDVPLATFTLAEQVPAILTGASVDVPLATFTLAEQVPEIATGASVDVPLATFTLAEQVPEIATGASVDVPLATFTLAEQVPEIIASENTVVDVPLATFTLSAQVPEVAAGASVDVPVATFTLAPLVPTIIATDETVVDVPLATFTFATQIPEIAAGASVDVPVATFTLAPLAPTITAGVAVIPFASMAIETDEDRLAVMTHDNVTVVYGGSGYLGVMAETDGETLDGDRTFDGLMELQMRTSDIDASGMAEDDTVTIGSVTYTIGKIDDIGGGMSTLYLF